MAAQAPTIEDFSADSGARGDGVTDANVVTLWGKAGANTTVTVYDGSTRLGTATTNASGAWSFTTPKLTDSKHSMTATASDSSGTSAASQAFSINVVPSVTQLVSGTDNWSNPTVIDGQGWYNENAGKSWSLTAPDSHTVRMELRAGDYWADGGDSSRSEILAANSVANGQTFNASYAMTVEPGTLNVGSGLSWLSLTQMYGADGATFSIQLKGEQMAVVVNLNEPTEKQVYLDSSPIQRGHAYNIQIQAHFAADSSGYLDIWRDGIQIVDYHGILGDAGANYNLKLGIYRGDPSAANYTMAADYSNIVTSTDPKFPIPPYNGAGGQTPTPANSPVISSFSTDSGQVGDGVTNDNTLVLSGTASAGNTVKVYDGATLLGSATANSSGAWNFATGTLADGKHGFSAAAASANGASAQSQSLAVVVDTVAPAAPAISSSTPKAGQSSVLTLKGSAEANSKVNVYDGKALLGSATANGSGAWTFTTAALSTGAHQFTASSTDIAGNSSKGSSAFDVSIKAPSSAPSVTSVSTSGSGIVAGSGNLSAGKTVTLALKFSEAVTVDGGVPKLKLNDGGTAAYVGGSGTDTLTFKYNVAAGQNTSDLAVTAINLGTATVRDSSGASADVAGAMANPAGTLHIDTLKPRVISTAASGRGITNGSGNIGVGKVVNLTLKLSEAVTVTGGNPTLKLNDGGTATYVGGSGTDTLTFKYTVAAGQNTRDLAITSVNSGTARVRDGAGNIADLSGAMSDLAGTLQVHTKQPTSTAQLAAAATNGSDQSSLPQIADHQWLGSPALLSDTSNAALESTRGADHLNIASAGFAGASAADMASTDQRLALFAQYIAASSAPPLGASATSPIDHTTWGGTEQHFAQPLANQQQHAPTARPT
jgi:hypothetical protein